MAPLKDTAEAPQLHLAWPIQHRIGCSATMPSVNVQRSEHTMKADGPQWHAAQPKEGRRPMWLPWIAGPYEETAGPVLVSLTEFRANAWRHLPGMGRIALGLRAGWYGLSGAVGLYLWSDLPRRCVGSLSIWTDEADLRRWIALPRHVQVMRRYRPRGMARSTQWTCETFDRAAILAEAKRRLAAGELSSHRGTATPS